MTLDNLVALLEAYSASHRRCPMRQGLWGLTRRRCCRSAKTCCKRDDLCLDATRRENEVTHRCRGITQAYGGEPVCGVLFHRRKHHISTPPKLPHQPLRVFIRRDRDYNVDVSRKTRLPLADAAKPRTNAYSRLARPSSTTSPRSASAKRTALTLRPKRRLRVAARRSAASPTTPRPDLDSAGQ